MPEKPSQQGNPDQWFTVGGHDFQSAILLFQQYGPADTITVLLQQAAEKYLKGYLLARGWKLQKTHDLEVLVAEAAKLDKAFEQFLGLARRLSGFYVRNRYPPLLPADYPREEVANVLEQTQELIATVRQAIV